MEREKYELHLAKVLDLVAGSLAPHEFDEVELLFKKWIADLKEKAAHNEANLEKLGV